MREDPKAGEMEKWSCSSLLQWNQMNGEERDGFVQFSFVLRILREKEGAKGKKKSKNACVGKGSQKKYVFFLYKRKKEKILLDQPFSSISFLYWYLCCLFLFFALFLLSQTKMILSCKLWFIALFFMPWKTHHHRFSCVDDRFNYNMLTWLLTPCWCGYNTDSSAL